ncbi:MAG: hypothetical protein ACD_75C01862G0003 [uncultured bacterium]|nr:MAG: hypothetical protein ACD_75C01862G0003 [uncultured bacterium]
MKEHHSRRIDHPGKGDDPGILGHDLAALFVESYQIGHGDPQADQAVQLQPERAAGDQGMVLKG